ncbi:PilZ domain-containing protein [Cohnella zeiphila]|uniref:PilZ domain-containing protein n=1 Tax=Cohnella zeiphila TaxID=2761120 RepID=A0A7X0SP65_9BACL|nr:PilZ domain-containing protein [Cohnella zeiphila]MBB6732479.1 PilZ domain-containing protein [Cohnella zeiphila]
MNWEDAGSGFTRRKHVRLQMPAEEGALVRIVAIASRALASPPGRVRLANVSEGGCCFESGLRFPVLPEMRLELGWPIDDCPLALPGHIVWRADTVDGYRYGMKFALSEMQRTALIGRLNERLIELCPDQTKIHALYRMLSARPKPGRGKEASI